MDLEEGGRWRDGLIPMGFVERGDVVRMRGGAVIGVEMLDAWLVGMRCGACTAGLLGWLGWGRNGACEVGRRVSGIARLAWMLAWPLDWGRWAVLAEGLRCAYSWGEGERERGRLGSTRREEGGEDMI